MRRVILAVSLGGLLLAGAGCDTAPQEGANAPGATAPGAAAPASAPPSSAAPDYTADTRAVCGKLQTIFKRDFRAVGTELGTFLAFKEAKQKKDEAKARQAAAKRLRTVAANIRKATAAAQDPAVQTAGDVSADKIEESAGDAAFFKQIKSRKQLQKVIEGQMTDWLSPVAGHCG